MRRIRRNCVEVCVIAFVVVSLVGAGAATISLLDDANARVRCASNLRQIGQALLYGS